MTLHYEGILFVVVGLVGLLIQKKMRNATIKWWRYWTPKTLNDEGAYERGYGPIFWTIGIATIFFGLLMFFGVVVFR